ncbi:unnamed protein product [Vitrella brassicaformis CCMP3155]|uniref:Uncharacterized protein n=2 Tax=Vitrella brassicaformis TaxID=1169539 RepID=A0A0G4H1A7_VITBC|nr:unnamed protein product [Vitrella brassicaformis CCMP3155]|eukprot:CEM37231.1 unnamed protein product [Vitrella brassicaformis CCMP3155]
MTMRCWCHLCGATEASADPVEPLRKANPAAYQLVKALLAKSDLGLLYNDSHERKGQIETAFIQEADHDEATGDPLAELRRENPSAYSIVHSLLLKQEMGFDPIAKRHGVEHDDLSFLQITDDPMAAIRLVDPKAFDALIAALKSSKSHVATIYADRIKYQSLLQLTADPLSPLKAHDPQAYALVERILRNSALGKLLSPPAFLQRKGVVIDPTDPLAPLQQANPAAYAIVKALLMKSQLGLNLSRHRPNILLQMGANISSVNVPNLEELAPLKRTDPAAYALVAKLLANMWAHQKNPSGKARSFLQRSMAIRLSHQEPPSTVEGLYATVKRLLRASFFGNLLLQINSHRAHGGADPLAALKAANPAAYSIVKGLLGKSGLASVLTKKGRKEDARGVRPSLLQESSEKPMDTASLMAELTPVLTELSSLDMSAFNSIQKALAGVSGSHVQLSTELRHAKSQAADVLLQTAQKSFPHGRRGGQKRIEDTEDKLIKLRPILDRLRSLDEETFGKLSMMAQQMEDSVNGVPPQHINGDEGKAAQAMSILEALPSKSPFASDDRTKAAPAYGVSVDRASPSNGNLYLGYLSDGATQAHKGEDVVRRFIVENGGARSSRAADTETQADALTQYFRSRTPSTQNVLALIQDKVSVDPLQAVDMLAPIIDKLSSLDPKMARVLRGFVSSIAERVTKG